MGVDYTANFGIGYKINYTDYDETTEILEDSPYRYFKVGEGSYTGEDDELYVVLRKPFADGLDFTQKKEDLYTFLTDNNIEIDGEFGLQGGLYVW